MAILITTDCLSYIELSSCMWQDVSLYPIASHSLSLGELKFWISLSISS